MRRLLQSPVVTLFYSFYLTQQTHSLIVSVVSEFPHAYLQPHYYLEAVLQKLGCFLKQLLFAADIAQTGVKGAFVWDQQQINTHLVFHWVFIVCGTDLESTTVPQFFTQCKILSQGCFYHKGLVAYIIINITTWFNFICQLLECKIWRQREKPILRFRSPVEETFVKTPPSFVVPIHPHICIASHFTEDLKNATLNIWWELYSSELRFLFFKDKAESILD